MPFSQGTDDSTGLLGHFEGTITDAEFASNPEAETAEMREKVYLYLTVGVDDILQEEYNGADVEEITVRMGLGSDWQTEDRRFVENKKDGKDRLVKFRTQSVYGKFINLVLGKADSWAQAKHQVEASDGDDSDISCDYGSVLDDMEKRDANERDAKSWVGSRWEFRGVTITYPSTKTAPIAVNSTVPVRYLGWDDSVREQEAGEVGGQGQAEANSQVKDESEEISEKGLTSEGNGSSVFFSSDEELNKALNAVLREAPTYAEFRKKAAMLASQASDDKALTLVLNESKVWNK